MEELLENHNCTGTRNTSCTSATAALGMQKNSQIIAKVKPKIRIIHIFAPEIIKTDVANFRELVQRLTGKPTDEVPRRTNPSTKKRSRNGNNVPTMKPVDDHRNSPSNNLMMIQRQPLTSTRLDLKGEEEIWRNANSGGSFLGGFTELEGFMEQLNQHQIQEFPLNIPLDQAAHHHQHHHHMDAFGQSLQLA